MDVLVAMSGGVDSSVAAWLLKEHGYACIGATLKLCDKALLGCEPYDLVPDARHVAQVLGLPFHVFDGTRDFKFHVAEPFIAAYENGDTPNPCICCNRYIKFGLLLDKAIALGCSHIATGHYAKIQEKDGNLFGKMASEGTTPRRLTDLIGSLCDLTSGSGDKGTPIVYIQGYFDNYTNE